MLTSSQQRLQGLESRFMELEGKLAETPEKEAISMPGPNARQVRR